MAGDGTAIRITDVRTIGVPVRDQDRALKFYTTVLGFDTRMDVSFATGARWIEVAPPGASTSIALVLEHDGVPAGVETGIRLTTADAEAGLHDSAGAGCRRRRGAALARRAAHVRLP